jgi:hypothetical protein
VVRSGVLIWDLADLELEPNQVKEKIGEEKILCDPADSTG